MREVVQKIVTGINRLSQEDGKQPGEKVPGFLGLETTGKKAQKRA